MYSDNSNEAVIVKLKLMKTYSTIRKNEFGKTIVDTKKYKTLQGAIDASNSWLRDCTVHKSIRELRSVEIIENN